MLFKISSDVTRRPLFFFFTVLLMRLILTHFIMFFFLLHVTMVNFLHIQVQLSIFSGVNS